MTKESLTFEYLEKENILFANKKENGEGKERKYLKKKSIFFAEETEKEGRKYLVKENMFFCGGEEKQRRSRRKCLEKENKFSTEELLEHWLWKHWKPESGW